MESIFGISFKIENKYLTKKFCEPKLYFGVTVCIEIWILLKYVNTVHLDYLYTTIDFKTETQKIMVIYIIIKPFMSIFLSYLNIIQQVVFFCYGLELAILSHPTSLEIVFSTSLKIVAIITLISKIYM